MAEERVRRRLAAILAADTVGYSRLMEADEMGTIARQKAHRKELIDPKITAHNGRIVKTTGDGLLVEFASVVDCAGTYFISADFRPLGFNGDDVDLGKHITVEAGVTTVPVSAFYGENPPRHFARFSFCKTDDVLDAAIEWLAKHFKA